MSVVDTVEILKGRALDDAEYLRAAVLGWGVELVRPSLFPLLYARALTASLPPFPPSYRRVYVRV